MKRFAWFGFAAVAAMALYLGTPRSVLSQNSPAELGPDVAHLRVEFGATDAAPRDWSGKLSVSGGEIVALRDWRPRPGHAIEGKSTWKMATWKAPNFVKRPWEKPFNEPQLTYIRTVGLLIQVRGSSATRLSLATPQGTFEVSPFVLNLGETRKELSGQILVERVPAIERVSSGQTDADFASLWTGPDGSLWTAWVDFSSGKNAVLTRRFDGKAWSAPEKVSEDHGDIFLAKGARDGKGGVWIAWSSQIGGNFDLYARRFDGRRWGAIERLSSAPQPDIYLNMTTDSNGAAWVAWQGFREGKSHIFARRWDGAWSPEERVSTSAANDWGPTLAADAKGAVYIAWDTYDKGNYDAVLRRWSAGRWDPVLEIAATGKFEAYPSIAVDAQGRLWAAWNESGFEWGKDTGFLPKFEGTPLYSWRIVKTAVWDGARWLEPAAPFEESMPTSLRGYNDLPNLAADGSGKVWLFFRHRTIRQPDMPSDTPLHRANWEIYATTLDGPSWRPPVQMPVSQARQDVRTGFAARDGALYAAYASDRRDYEDFLYRKSDLYVARMPVSSGPAPSLRARSTGELKFFPIHPDERADLDRIHNATIESAGRRFKIYRGDTHRHTEFSMDGNNDGSLLDAYRYAIDAAELDFLMVSEHNGNAGPDQEYVNFLLQQMADVFTISGKFLPLYGYERSVAYPNGHRNVVFAKRGNPTLPIPQSELRGETGAAMLYEYLKKYDGIAISHTSASSMGTDWRDNDPDVEPLVEIYQGDRVSNEYEGAPKAAYTAQPASAPGGFRPAGYVWNAWAKGYKLGVQAASDHLSTHISYACTLSEHFTKEALLDGMKKRQSYGATDNIVLDYQMLTDEGPRLQGAITRTAGPIRLRIRVQGTRPLRQIDIIRSNAFIDSRQFTTSSADYTFTDAQPLPGESYYYVRVQQVDDQMAWSSPIWVTR
jgi:hypothetical protein